MLLIEMQDDFDVRRRLKAVSPANQFLSKRWTVVDFSIAHQLQGVRLVAHRLPTALDVDDAQAPLTDRDAITVVKTVVIGTAMGEYAGHPGNGLSMTEPHDSCYSAHKKRS
jgi:hypothetical protein